MANITIPIAPEISVLINDTAVGALQSFRERSVQKLNLLRQLGSSDNLDFHNGAAEHTIHLRYLMPFGCSLVQPPADPHGLQNFVLEIRLADRVLHFTGCQYASVETSCTLGGSILCEAEIHALTRSCVIGEE